jgi:hypothetical protein
MHSSIFNSKSLAFVLALLLPIVGLVVPNEIAIRAVEAQFGRDARFGYPTSDIEKLDWFLQDLQASGTPDTLIVGNSQCLYGLIPDAFRYLHGGTAERVYNLSFSGTSFIDGLEIARGLNLAAKTVIACVSAADFTADMVSRGDGIITKAASQAPKAEPESDGVVAATHRRRQWLEDRIALSVAEICRSTERKYRRSAADYVHLADGETRFPRNLEELGRFLTTGHSDFDALENGRYVISLYHEGFLALRMLQPWIDEQKFRQLAVDPIVKSYEQSVFPDYRRNSAPLFARAMADIKDIEARGSEVILVRLPEFVSLGEAEERETSFSRDIAHLANELKVRFIEADFVGIDFNRSPLNFRDAAHLHAVSANAVSIVLATRLAGR